MTARRGRDPCAPQRWEMDVWQGRRAIMRMEILTSSGCCRPVMCVFCCQVLYLCWRKVIVIGALCSGAAASHVKGFNTSVSSAVTSEKERVNEGDRQETGGWAGDEKEGEETRVLKRHVRKRKWIDGIGSGFKEEGDDLKHLRSAMWGISSQKSPSRDALRWLRCSEWAGQRNNMLWRVTLVQSAASYSSGHWTDLVWSKMGALALNYIWQLKIKDNFLL